MKKLTSVQSVFNTPPLIRKILYLAKKRDETYKSPTAKLIKQIYFVPRRWTGEIVISKCRHPERVEDILFPWYYKIKFLHSI